MLEDEPLDPRRSNSNKLRAYLETLPDKQLIKLMRLAGIPEWEIEKSRSVPGPFEREIPYRRSGSQ